MPVRVLFLSTLVACVPIKDSLYEDNLPSSAKHYYKESLVDNVNETPYSSVQYESDSNTVDKKSSGGSSSGGRSGGSSSGGSGSGGRSGGSSSGSSSSGGRSGGSSSGSSSSGGRSGGSSSSSSGGKGGKGGKGNKGGKGSEEDPLPPYTPREHPDDAPPPYHQGTYGNRGTYRNNWNGQFYPYRSYGYGSAVPISPAPLYLAGPFGFYGPYSSPDDRTGEVHDVTVSDFYLNGTILSNYTWVNGTYVNSTFEHGVYTIMMTRGDYKYGELIRPGLVVNGTFIYATSNTTKIVINPNQTANGTVLHESHGANHGPAGSWMVMALATVGLLL